LYRIYGTQQTQLGTVSVKVVADHCDKVNCSIMHVQSPLLVKARNNLFMVQIQHNTRLIENTILHQSLVIPFRGMLDVLGDKSG